jgi:hypothetical protein
MEERVVGSPDDESCGTTPKQEFRGQGGRVIRPLATISLEHLFLAA